jgi:hypothetical protein
VAAESFFRRWAKRKAESIDSASPAEDDAAPRDDLAPRLPDLGDVARLTAESDYSLFVTKGIDKTVQRAAMKKLFSDPHFNTMDGLDIYIGDYTRASPLPAAMRAALQHAKNLFAPLPPVEKEERITEPATEHIAAASASDQEATQDLDPAPRVQSDDRDSKDSSPDPRSS